jgi:RNA recognition motif-containing protein
MRLYVCNFPWSTTESELEDLFKEFGDIVSCHITTDRESGRSRGFGFVEFADREDAIDAMEQLDATMLGGRKIHVVEARPRTYSAAR